MLIYHPSNKKFNIARVKCFGDNAYTQNDKKASPILRTFWYTKFPILEDRFKDVKYVYIAKVNKKDIYNLSKDTFNFKRKFNNIHKMLLYLKKEYLGVQYKIANYELVVLFKNIKPIKRKNNRYINENK